MHAYVSLCQKLNNHYYYDFVTLEGMRNTLTSFYREFRSKAMEYLKTLGEHYGGKIKCESLTLHIKPCLKDLIVYQSELFIFAENEKFTLVNN